MKNKNKKYVFSYYSHNFKAKYIIYDILFNIKKSPYSKYFHIT